MGRTDRGNHLLSAWLTVWGYRVITIIPIIQRHRVILDIHKTFHKSPWSWPAADCIAGKCSSRSWIPSTGSAGSPSCSGSRYSTEKNNLNPKYLHGSGTKISLFCSPDIYDKVRSMFSCLLTLLRCLDARVSATLLLTRTSRASSTGINRENPL